MASEKNLRLLLVIILVVAFAALTNFVLYNVYGGYSTFPVLITNNESGPGDSVHFPHVDGATHMHAIAVDPMNFSHDHIIPHYPDIHKRTPWRSFHLNLTQIIHQFYLHDIATTESLHYVLPPPQEAKLKTANWDNEIPSHYMTCRNLSLPWDYPQGIPSMEVRSTSQFEQILHRQFANDTSKLLTIDFSQLIDFDALCMLHTPGYVGDNAIFNKQQFYKLTYEWMGSYNCYADHIPDFLCDPSLATCSDQGTVTLMHLHNRAIKVINIAFRLTGWGASAFSHFHIFDVPEFAMIYNMLVDLKLESMNEHNLYSALPAVFYNVSLVTNLNAHNAKDLQHWFFRQFGLIPFKTVRVTTYMNISVINTYGWCMSDNRVHWSPLLISPHFMRYKEKFNGVINMRWKLLAKNTMLNIKPFLSNMSATRNIVLYMDRGRGSRRGVQNNQRVIETIEKFVSDNAHRLPFKFETFERKHDRDKEREYLSKVAIMIGPHGGAFANINIMQPGSYVVEFINWWSDAVNLTKSVSQKFRPCYYALSTGGAMHYYYLKPDVFNFERGAMEIDLDKLQTLLHTVYSDIEQNGFSYDA